MASLSLRNIKKIYGNDVVAVQEFSLDIADREFVVLVGPSGCGKSTLLRMIAGLEEISGGELRIGERLVNDVYSKDRDIAMVFQNYALYPHMTVRENMAFALKMRKESKEATDRKVREAAELLDITPYLNRKPRELSGGQRQRVAIGRAIVRRPAVFLMDEPLSNLDAKLRNQMRAELIKLRKRIDTTFIYVTHDQTEAMTLGDRIVIMKDGVIQQIGTPQEVFNHPANVFVAGFIGTPQMNFFDAMLIRDSGSCRVECNGAVVDLPESASSALSAKEGPPEKITLGIRPEHIRIVPRGTENSVQAHVEVSEMMGSEVYLHVDIGGRGAVLRVQLAGDAAPDQTGLTAGSAVNFTFPGGLVHVFGGDGLNLITSNSEQRSAF